MAEPVDGGPAIRQVSRAAAELGMVIVAPIYELDPTTETRFSTAVVIDTDGEILGTYRKSHVPRGTNEAGSFYENFYIAPSNGQFDNRGGRNIFTSPFFSVFRTPWIDLGVALCYDRHFEGVVSTLAAQGAELVLCPSIVFGEQTRRRWLPEFRAGTCRHNVFTTGTNRRGAEPPCGVELLGDSHVSGPAGDLPDVSTRADLVVADVNPSALEQPHPAGWSLQRDSRVDIL
jgi:beta-ureidopropionase